VFFFCWKSALCLIVLIVHAKMTGRAAHCGGDPQKQGSGDIV
jgi:hypothetical protein